MSWLGRAMPGSELHPRVLPALQTRAHVSAHVKETRHTRGPSPALRQPRSGPAAWGGREPGSGSHSPKGHNPPPGWEHRATPSATHAGRSSPWETAAAAGAPGDRGLTATPQGITTGGRVFSKPREAQGPSPPPREDTTHCNPRTARPSA